MIVRYGPRRAQSAELFLPGGGRAVSPTVQRLLGGGPERVPERYGFASPAALAPLGVPQLVVHGQADRHVPVDQSVRYAAAARAAGDDVGLVTRGVWRIWS